MLLNFYFTKASLVTLRAKVMSNSFLDFKNFLACAKYMECVQIQLQLCDLSNEQGWMMNIPF